MKKQINPTIKAHLIRGAFYLLLLVAVCAIPFALAQRSKLLPYGNRGVPDLPRRSWSAGLTNAYGTVPAPAKGGGLHVFVPVSRQPNGTCPATITESTSQSIVDGNSVACSADGGITTTQNSYWRAFNMNTFTGGQEYDVTSISFGIELARSGNGTGQSLTVNLYANHGSPFPLGDWQSNMIATSGSINIPDQSDTIFMVPMTATVAAGTLELVMEVNSPDGTNLGNAFFVGSNNLAETAPSYLSAPDCGITTPTTTGDLGFPDDHIVFNVNGSCPSGSPTPTSTPPSPTPTATASACNWSAGPDLPFAGTRFGGVFFPANGKFYAMGGRDVNNVEFTHPFEFDPVGNSWTTKTATYPDAFVSNIECAVANDSGTDYIYCVGGSSFATQTSIGRVFRFDPVADVIITLSTNWPPGDANVLPGGIAAFNNNIFILGGFNINTSVTDEIWQFTPNPAGWVKKGATLPVPRGYIPTTTIGSFIYTGGGADWDPIGMTLVDTSDSFKYDPTADSIASIASIPRPTSNTRALNFCSQMYVIGGAFNAISNEVDIYDPGSDSWSVGQPFNTARRNAATDTDGTNNIWLAGGYDASVTIIASTEIFNCPMSPCAAPSATPTATIQATATPTATPTGTPGRTSPTPRPRPTPAPRP